jgi:hypothetical protein
MRCPQASALLYPQESRHPTRFRRRAQTPDVQKRHVVPDQLLALAARQGGVVSREQVDAHGVSRHVVQRLITTGIWHPVARGIYSTVPTPGWTGLAWAGLLIGGDGGRLGPRSSGHLHGLLPEAPLPIDVLIPYERRIRSFDSWLFIRERPGARSGRTLGDLSHLGVEDTVLDLCAGATEGELVGLLTTAVNRRRTTAARLLNQLERRPRHPYRKLLTDILGDVRHGVESALEWRYVHLVERPHDLPRSDLQRPHGLPYFTDVAYDDYQTLVELDGRDGHEGEGRFRDMVRDNRHALRWLLTLRYGWHDVLTRPCAIAFEVAQALTMHGWSGIPTRCPNCLNVPDADLGA